MKVNVKVVKPIELKTLKISMKVRDEFCCDILDENGGTIVDGYEGYVPGFMPEDHYGDYLYLDIDLETGMITNWGEWTAQRKRFLQEFVEEHND